MHTDENLLARGNGLPRQSDDFMSKLKQGMGRSCLYTPYTVSLPVSHPWRYTEQAADSGVHVTLFPDGMQKLINMQLQGM